MARILYVGNKSEVIDRVVTSLKGDFVLDACYLKEGLQDTLRREEDYYNLTTLDFNSTDSVDATLYRQNGITPYNRITEHFRCESLGIIPPNYKKEFKDRVRLNYTITPEEDFQIMAEILSLVIELIIKIKIKTELKRKIEQMAQIIDNKDLYYTQGHFKEVKAIAVGIGEELKLKQKDIEKIEIMSMVHDFSRLGYPDIKDIMREIEKSPEPLKVISGCESDLFSILMNNLDRIEPTLGHYYEIFEEKGKKREPFSLEEIVVVAEVYDLLVNFLPPEDYSAPEKAFDKLEREGFNSNILNALWIAADKLRLSKEKSAYQRMENSLKKEYQGKFVAILNGKVVGVGEDSVKVAMEVYQNPEYGYVTTYITQVGVKPRVGEISTPFPAIEVI